MGVSNLSSARAVRSCSSSLSSAAPRPCSSSSPQTKAAPGNATQGEGSSDGTPIKRPGGLAVVGRQGSVVDLKELEKSAQNRTAVRQPRAALTPTAASRTLFTANGGGATASATVAAAGLTPQSQRTLHASSANISAFATPTANRRVMMFPSGAGDAAAAPPADGDGETEL